MKRDYVNEREWAPRQIEGILDLARTVKQRPEEFRKVHPRSALCEQENKLIDKLTQRRVV